MSEVFPQPRQWRWPFADHLVQACLDLWSSADDGVRIAAFLAIRQLASTTDASVLDLVLKVCRLSLCRR